MAGPNGARAVEKSMVLAAFTSGQAFLKASGHQSTTVLSLDKTRLDEHYALVRAQFEWRFEKGVGAAARCQGGFHVRLVFQFWCAQDSLSTRARRVPASAARERRVAGKAIDSVETVAHSWHAHATDVGDTFGASAA
jgi:hypothetical protein